MNFPLYWPVDASQRTNVSRICARVAGRVWLKVDLRDAGTILLHEGNRGIAWHITGSYFMNWNRLSILPATASYLKERSVNPSLLSAAALKAAKHREVDISSGAEVTEDFSYLRQCLWRTDHQNYISREGIVVNCAGAWAGQFPPMSRFGPSGERADSLRHRRTGFAARGTGARDLPGAASPMGRL